MLSGGDGEPTKTPDLDEVLHEAGISQQTLRDAIKGLVFADNVADVSSLPSADASSEDLETVVTAVRSRKTLADKFLVANRIVTTPPT